jgi:uncharacterized protein VirK/YbjX
MSTTKKPYPLGIDNPYQIRGRIGTNKWEIIDRETRQCLGLYPTELVAYDCRRALLRHAGYDA